VKIPEGPDSCLSNGMVTLKPAELHPHAGLSLEEVVDLRPARRYISSREVRSCIVCGARLHPVDDNVCGACEYGLELEAR
jgi:hypothetical protein